MTSRRKSFQCKLEIMEDRLVLSAVTTTIPTTAVVATSTPSTVATTTPTLLSTFQQSAAQGQKTPLQINFGPSSAVVPQGAISASTQGYSTTQGYGWVGTVNSSGNVTNLTAASNTSTSGSSTAPTVGGTSGQFRVNLPNGTYNIGLLFANAPQLGSLTIALDSAGGLGGSLSQGETNSTLQLWSGQVNVTDGEMTTVLTGPFALQSMTITPASVTQTVTSTSPITDPLPTTITPVTTPTTTTTTTTPTSTTTATATVVSAPTTTTTTPTTTTPTTTTTTTPVTAPTTTATTPTPTTGTAAGTTTPATTAAPTSTAASTGSPIRVQAPTSSSTGSSSTTTTAKTKAHAVVRHVVAHESWTQKLGHSLDKFKTDIFGHSHKKA